ncbi:MAG TPA: metallophosphoesterase [Clostridia bacterium]|nr:metallophosphoesterase [Clostridia bacterium]
MRLLYITDTHIRGTSPRNRVDNFPDSLKIKLEEIVELLEEYQVDYMLHGGDFFDLPNPSLAVTSTFVNVFMKIPVPVFGIAGNHDIFAYNLGTLQRTMLGFLASLGVIKLLEPGEPVYLKKEGMTVQLTGQHFHHDIDRRDPLLDYAVKKKDCDLAIHMVHGMLLDRPFFPGARHTLIEKVAPFTEADYTLCGHAHLGFRDINSDGRFFINPGAIARLTAHPAEITRVPQVLLLDFNNGTPNTRKIKLKKSAPGKEVLNRGSIEMAAFQEQRLAQFVQGIKSSGDYHQGSLKEIIETIAKQEKLQSGVKEEALRRIGAIQEQLSSGR